MGRILIEKLNLYHLVVALLLHFPPHYLFFPPYYIIALEENNWRVCSPSNLSLPSSKRLSRDWARKNKEDIVPVGKSYSDS